MRVVCVLMGHIIVVPNKNQSIVCEVLGKLHLSDSNVNQHNNTGLMCQLRQMSQMSIHFRGRVVKGVGHLDPV